MISKKDLLWIHNMEHQHHTVCPNFPEKRRRSQNTEREHQTFSHHGLERNKERREMTAAPPSASQETPPRQPFSFCSLLPQRFAAAAPTLNSFARNQLSVTLLTEGKKDITLKD